MIKHLASCSLLALSLCCSSQTLMANGVRLFSQDAFAAGRGQAFVATADNPSAIYYNPAGLTQLEGHHLRGGISGLYFDPTFEPPAGQANSGTTYHIGNTYAVAPQLYYSHKWKSVPVSAGLGIYSPYGASVTWPQDTGFRSLGYEGELTYIRANPVVAAEIAPGLSLGCGVMIDYAKLATEQGVSDITFVPNYYRFEGDDWGIGFNVGLLWKLHEKLSVGATFRSQTTLNFKGTSEILRQFQTQPREVSASLEYEYPLTGVFGISYRPTPRWNLEVNLDYTDWSSFDTTTVRHEETPPFPVPQDDVIDLHWKASWMYEFGVTHYFSQGWHVSAGYLFNQNSVPDDYYVPVVADLERHFLSVGAGRRGEHWSFDLAYQFGYGYPRTVVGSTSPSGIGRIVGQNGDGTYEWISHAVLVSVGLQF